MIKNILTSLVISILVLFTFVEFYPLFQNDNLGIANLTDLTGTDTLSNFPTVYTNNNTTLETAINTIEGTTTNTTITSLANLATVGTITSGTWQGTGIGVGYGGTGSTTLATNYIMLGNGSSGFKTVSGLGSSGQFLTSQGSGSAPQWTTSSINEAGNYNFTGTNFRILNLRASSTASNPMYLNGIDYAFPSVEGASSTVLSTDGSGALSWVEKDWELLDSVTLSGAAAEFSTGIFADADPIRIIIDTEGQTSPDPIRFRLNDDTGSNYGYVRTTNGAASNPQSAQTSIDLLTSTTSEAYIVIDIRNDTSDRKFITWQSSANNSGANAPQVTVGSGVWNNTSDAIASSSIEVSTGNFNSGADIWVFGKRK